MSRRVIELIVTPSLDISLLGLAQQVVGGAPSQRHNGQGWILVGIADEAGSVGNKKISYFVGLAVAVERRLARVRTHANHAEPVDDLSAAGNVILRQAGAKVGAAGSGDDLP